jgi:phage terminase small subunit
VALNERQSRFVQEYRKDRNATQAAIRAGYSKHTAKQSGSRMLSNLDVKMALAEVRERFEKQVDVTVEGIVRNLAEVAERCLQKVPVMERDPTDRRDLRQKRDLETGEGVWEFDASGANRSLELLGKHLGMLTEKHELAGPGGKSIAIFIGGIKK